MTKNSEAVKVDGRRVSLEVCYSIANVCSDSNTFSETIGGRGELTEAQAIAAVIEAAHAWAQGRRADGDDMGVWDAAGNHY